MLNGEGKKLLLFAPLYFGYEQQIKSVLSSRGFEVNLIYENMDRVSYYFKFIQHRFPELMYRQVNEYFRKEIEKCSEKTEYVLVIRGSYLSCETIEFMKRRFASNCRFVFYQWDSVKNNLNAEKIAGLFDDVFSFDIFDCDKYGWKYRPLFYIDNYVEERNKDIDILFVCSLHSDRARIYHELKEICNDYSWSCRAVLYEKRYIFLKRKYLDRKPAYLSVKNSEMTYKPLSIEQTYDLYSRSKTVVDYTHPGQTGFTMRTIESIGNHCKLVTNNQLVKNADFYDQNNIMFYDQPLRIPEEFMKSGYKENSAVSERYSIHSFLEELLVRK